MLKNLIILIIFSFPWKTGETEGYGTVFAGDYHLGGKIISSELHVTHFETFSEAQEYWDFYADAPTCVAGEMIDLDTKEIIWEFDES